MEQEQESERTVLSPDWIKKKNLKEKWHPLTVDGETMWVHLRQLDGKFVDELREEHFQGELDPDMDISDIDIKPFHKAIVVHSVIEPQLDNGLLNELKEKHPPGFSAQLELAVLDFNGLSFTAQKKAKNEDGPKSQ